MMPPFTLYRLDKFRHFSPLKIKRSWREHLIRCVQQRSRSMTRGLDAKAVVLILSIRSD